MSLAPRHATGMLFTLLARDDVDVVKNATDDNGVPCTIDICTIDSSQYAYRISLIATLIFISILGGLTINFVATYIITRRAFSFNLLMTFATAAGLVGYIGRLLSWYDQWAKWPYFMQLCLLTVAPTFISAGIYLSFRRVIDVFGDDHSAIDPSWYIRIASLCIF